MNIHLICISSSVGETTYSYNRPDVATMSHTESLKTPNRCFNNSLVSDFYIFNHKLFSLQRILVVSRA